MLCSFRRLIYPKSIPEANTGVYTVAVYDVHDPIKDEQGKRIKVAKVVGYYLPLAEGLRFDITGCWAKNAKHGSQFEMGSYREVIAPTKEGIVGYLSSGLIKGIGPKTAAKIYDSFGSGTLDMLDSNPEKLLQIKGISEMKLRQILDSYVASRGARDVVALLAPFGVTPGRAVGIYKHFGAQAVEIVRKHPYRLCDMAGIGFIRADAIARSMGLDPMSPERIAAGLIYTLKEAEVGGHLCLEKDAFLRLGLKLLNTEGMTEMTVALEAFKLLKSGRITLENGFVFRDMTARAERAIAARVCDMLATGSRRFKCDLNTEIEREQRKIKLSLSAEQATAVKTCLASRLSIITGGPGTGKTLIQKVILDIYNKERPDAKIICCAPTGRAARRMTQCTGYPASTIHKALGLMAGDNGEWNEPAMLDADLVLVDEVSMLDIYLAKHLFNSVPCGCQMILVGDADQLPSVGPGAVLSELIACGMIPVVKLDRVYRQNAGSRIAVNARLIRHENLSLEYGDDFRFHESANIPESAELLEGMYLSEVRRLGVDNVALLTPYRQKTETGVYALNERLRDKVNPPAPNKPEVRYGRRLFRLGDKVMQLKNNGDVNNGDVGYVTKVVSAAVDTAVQVDFGDGRIAEYNSDAFDSLELAYASTVHKSQGSEYASVLINLQKAHYIMLKRPLIYTAITRAKERITIVGERAALCAAIRKADAEKRGTLLAFRIVRLSGERSVNQKKVEENVNAYRS